MTLAELLLGLRDYQPRRGTLGMLQQQQVAARPEPQGVLGMGLADALAQWGRGVQDKAAQFTPQNIAAELSRLPKFDRNAAAQNVSPDAVNNMLSSNWMSFAPMGLGMIKNLNPKPVDTISDMGKKFIPNENWKPHENLASAMEYLGLKINKERGSSMSNSRYITIDDPSGGTVSIRLSNHQQTGKAISLHNSPDVDVSPENWNIAVKDAINNLNKQRKILGDQPIDVSEISHIWEAK